MLTKDVANVGKAGDVKEVTDGYGRNFLLPRKLAVPARKGVEAEAKRLRDAAVKRETKDRVDAQALADEIHIKTLGEHQVDLKLHRDVAAHVNVIVTQDR